MPDDQAPEKRALLEHFGAKVTIVPCCSIANENHYVNQARKRAMEVNGIFLNQFENEANTKAHYQDTGPEIWKQMNGQINAFVMSAGTGGTIAGVSRFLKEKQPDVLIVLADPIGSALHNRVEFGVCFTSQQQERRQRKHRYDSIVEGVGLDRVTRNFEQARIDKSEKVSDQEILDMACWLLQHEMLFVGSSSALNLVATCRTARSLPEGSRVVTVVCDSGHRHLSRFWNKAFIDGHRGTSSSDEEILMWPASNVIPSCLHSLL